MTVKRKNGRPTGLILFVLALGLMTVPPAARPAVIQDRPAPEPYLETEIERLEETYAVLDRFAGEVWPDWSNYTDIEFTVRFPNMVYLRVGPPGRIEEGYEAVPGRKVHGNQVYLNRKSELPIKVVPPLAGGGKGAMKILFRLYEVDPSTVGARSWRSEYQIFLYIHEMFHGFQSRAWKHSADLGTKNFNVSAEYAAYSEIEGRALLAAWKEKDKKKAIGYIRDYLAARRTKQGSMSFGAIRYEEMISIEEGTAVYAETMLARLVGEKGYRPDARYSHSSDFGDFKDVKAHFEATIIENIEDAFRTPLDTISRYFGYGAVQCLLLDRFVPDWKKLVFSGGQTLDDVMEGRFGLPPAETAAVVEGFKSRYGFGDVYARNAAAVREKDDAVNLINTRRGRSFQINIKPTGEFFMLKGRGKSVRMGVEEIFPAGVQDMKIEGIELRTSGEPSHQLGIYDYEWIDTRTPAGEKGYKMRSSGHEGGIYRDLVFECGGFTLHAPEAMVEESPGQVRIVVMTKAARR